MKQKRFLVSDVPMSSEHQHTRRLPVHYNQGFIDMISSRRSSLWGSRSCSLLFLWYLVYILLDFCFPRCTISSDPRLLDRENTGLRANKLADGQLASESPVIAAIPLTKSESRPFSNHYYLSLFDWPGTQITDRFLSFNKQLLGLTLLEYTELFLNQLLRSGIAATLQGRNSGQGNTSSQVVTRMVSKTSRLAKRIKMKKQKFKSTVIS